jgi:hypothetical protein
LFSEFDIVLLYYFNEEGQIVKEYWWFVFFTCEIICEKYILHINCIM